MQKVWDLAIIGGGASGMAAAIAASHLGDSVLLLEKSPALGRKIAASGNGRCNLMNLNPPVYFGDTSFAIKVIEHYPACKLKSFWESLGLILSHDSEGRVYPCTFHSGTVLDALKTALRRTGVEIRLQTAVFAIRHSGSIFSLDLNGETVLSRRVLIATGGAASSRLGGSFSGYELLESFGHHITRIKPALCPIITDKKSISGLSGTRVRCSIALFDSRHRKLCLQNGEVLFTDYGISGICAMQCARFIDDDSYMIELDLSQQLSMNRSDVTRLIFMRREKFSELTPEYLLNGILVPRLSYAVLKQAGIDLKNKLVGNLSDDELKAVVQYLCAYSLHVTGVRGLEDAQVTAGGAQCSEFSATTLESKLVPRLHVSGELLDVDGDCGGFNLMFAFTSGILAGKNGRN